jgi:hemolysin III
VLAALGGTYLLVLAGGDTPRQLSLLVYGGSLTALFAVSAIYHLGAFGPGGVAILRRLDHASIFVLIAGTHTPIAVNLLGGWWRVGVLAAVWGAAIAGAGAALAGMHPRRRVRAGLYVALGWLALAAVGEIAAVLPPRAVLLLAAGGVLYTAGGLVYASRWPDLWPRVMGYHEVFHILTVAAAVLIYMLMLVYVVPAARPR